MATSLRVSRSTVGPIKQVFFVLLFALVGISVQSALLGQLLPPQFAPNFIIVVAVFIGFHLPNGLGALTAFVVGFLQDLVSGTLLGPWAGASVIAFGALAALSQRIFVDSPSSVFVSVFLMSMVGDVVYVILSGNIDVAFTSFLTHAVFGGLSSAVIALLVFPLMSMVLVERDRNRYSKRRRH